VILSLTVILQFLTQLLTGCPNEHVSAFGLNLASFVFQTIRFLTFASDDMPWPFSPWPDGASGDDEDTTANIVADGQPPKPTASPSGILGGGTRSLPARPNVEYADWPGTVYEYGRPMRF